MKLSWQSLAQPIIMLLNDLTKKLDDNDDDVSFDTRNMNAFL